MADDVDVLVDDDGAVNEIAEDADADGANGSSTSDGQPTGREQASLEIGSEAYLRRRDALAGMSLDEHERAVEVRHGLVAEHVRERGEVSRRRVAYEDMVSVQVDEMLEERDEFDADGVRVSKRLQAAENIREMKTEEILAQLRSRAKATSDTKDDVEVERIAKKLHAEIDDPAATLDDDLFDKPIRVTPDAVVRSAEDKSDDFAFHLPGKLGKMLGR